MTRKCVSIVTLLVWIFSLTGCRPSDAIADKGKTEDDIFVSVRTSPTDPDAAAVEITNLQKESALFGVRIDGGQVQDQPLGPGQTRDVGSVNLKRQSEIDVVSLSKQPAQYFIYRLSDGVVEIRFSRGLALSLLEQESNTTIGKELLTAILGGLVIALGIYFKTRSLSQVRPKLRRILRIDILTVAFAVLIFALLRFVDADPSRNGKRDLFIHSWNSFTHDHDAAVIFWNRYRVTSDKAAKAGELKRCRSAIDQMQPYEPLGVDPRLADAIAEFKKSWLQKVDFMSRHIPSGWSDADRARDIELGKMMDAADAKVLSIHNQIASEFGDFSGEVSSTK